MPSQPPRRPSSFLASVLAAVGIVLTIASCTGRITPLGPDPAATMPQPRHLQSPFVLEAMRARAVSPAGSCPAGYLALPGDNSGNCYRMIGTPVTITSAAVSSVSVLPGPPGQHGGLATYGFTITLPADDAPALTAVTTTAYKSHGSLAISVAGRTWALPFVDQPFTSPQLQIPLPRNQALQLHRILVPRS